VNVVLGAWLFVSPWALGYLAVTGAAWNAHVAGAAIALVAALALYRPVVWHKLAAIVLGVWAAMAAWPLGYLSHAAVAVNAALVGLAVAALAFWAMLRDDDFDRLRRDSITT
jgi:membrane associated rhomboid family serine protease